MFMIPRAIRPPKQPAAEAEEKKIAKRKAVECLGYQSEMICALSDASQRLGQAHKADTRKQATFCKSKEDPYSDQTFAMVSRGLDDWQMTYQQSFALDRSMW